MTATAEFLSAGNAANSAKREAERKEWIEEVVFFASFGLTYDKVAARFGLKHEAFWKRLRTSIELDDCPEAARLYAKFKKQADEAREERAREIRRRKRDERLGIR